MQEEGTVSLFLLIADFLPVEIGTKLAINIILPRCVAESF